MADKNKQPEILKSVLESAQTSNDVRAKAWDSFYSTEDRNQFIQVVGSLPLDTMTKRRMLYAKFPESYTTAPSDKRDLGGLKDLESWIGAAPAAPAKQKIGIENEPSVQKIMAQPKTPQPKPEHITSEDLNKYDLTLPPLPMHKPEVRPVSDAENDAYLREQYAKRVANQDYEPPKPPSRSYDANANAAIQESMLRSGPTSRLLRPGLPTPIQFPVSPQSLPPLPPNPASGPIPASTVISSYPGGEQIRRFLNILPETAENAVKATRDILPMMALPTFAGGTPGVTSPHQMEQGNVAAMTPVAPLAATQDPGTFGYGVMSQAEGLTSPLAASMIPTLGVVNAALPAWAAPAIKASMAVEAAYGMGNEVSTAIQKYLAKDYEGMKEALGAASVDAAFTLLMSHKIGRDIKVAGKGAWEYLKPLRDDMRATYRAMKEAQAARKTTINVKATPAQEAPPAEAPMTEPPVPPMAGPVEVPRQAPVASPVVAPAKPVVASEIPQTEPPIPPSMRRGVVKVEPVEQPQIEAEVMAAETTPVAVEPPAPPKRNLVPLGNFYHGSPRQGFESLYAGSMLTNQPEWASGYTTKVNNDLTEDFTGAIYKVSPSASNVEYVDGGLHDAEQRLIDMASRINNGASAGSLRKAAEIVHSQTGIEAIASRSKDGSINGVIPLIETPVTGSLDPVEFLSSYPGRVSDNIQRALDRHKGKRSAISNEREGLSDTMATPSPVGAEQSAPVETPAPLTESTQSTQPTSGNESPAPLQAKALESGAPPAPIPVKAPRQFTPARMAEFRKASKSQEGGWHVVYTPKGAVLAHPKKNEVIPFGRSDAETREEFAAARADALSYAKAHPVSDVTGGQAPPKPKSFGEWSKQRAEKPLVNPLATGKESLTVGDETQSEVMGSEPPNPTVAKKETVEPVVEESATTEEPPAPVEPPPPTPSKAQPSGNPRELEVGEEPPKPPAKRGREPKAEKAEVAATDPPRPPVKAVDAGYKKAVESSSEDSTAMATSEFKRTTPAKGTSERQAFEAQYDATMKKRDELWSQQHELENSITNTKYGTKKREQLEAKLNKIKDQASTASDAHEPLRKQSYLAGLEDGASQIENEVLRLATQYAIDAKVQEGKPYNREDREALNVQRKETIEQIKKSIRSELKNVETVETDKRQISELTSEENEKAIAKAVNRLADEFISYPLTAEDLHKKIGGAVYGERNQMLRQKYIDKAEGLKQKFHELTGAPAMSNDFRRVVENIKNAYDVERYKELTKEAEEIIERETAVQKRITEEAKEASRNFSMSLRPISDAPVPAMNASGLWDGNVATDGNLATDGHSLIDTNAVKDKKKAGAVAQRKKQSKSVSGEVTKKMWDGMVESATTPLIEVGRADVGPSDLSFFATEDGTVYDVFTSRLRWLQSLTGANGALVSNLKQKSIVLTKDGTPVAGLGRANIDHPEIDLAVAKKAVDGDGTTPTDEPPRPVSDVASRIDKQANKLADDREKLRARGMRYQADDKDLIAEYLTEKGTPTKGEEFDIPYEEWMDVRGKHYEDAVEWKREKNFPSDATSKQSLQVADAEPPKPLTPKAEPVNRKTASIMALAQDYKAQGIERTRAWSQFVIDRGLTPEVDAKEFYQYYDAATPKVLEGKSIESAETPKPAPAEDPETKDYGKRVKVTTRIGKHVETKEGTVHRTLQTSGGTPVYEVVFDGNNFSSRTTMRDEIEFIADGKPDTEPPKPPTKHDYSSTQANLPAPLAEKVKALSAKIPDSALAGDGRETEPHVTVKYGLETEDADKVRAFLESYPPIRLRLGKTSIFSDPKFEGIDHWWRNKAKKLVQEYRDAQRKADEYYYSNAPASGSSYRPSSESEAILIKNTRYDAAMSRIDKSEEFESNFRSSSMAKKVEELEKELVDMANSTRKKGARKATHSGTAITMLEGRFRLLDESLGDPSPDVVKIDVDSPDLHTMNAAIKREFANVDTHPTYKPHVTLAYVEPGTGKRYAGMADLEGQEVTLDKVVFSSKSGEKVEIQLKGRPDTEPPTPPVSSEPPVSASAEKRSVAERPDPDVNQEEPPAPNYADMESRLNDSEIALTKARSEYQRLKTLNDIVSSEDTPPPAKRRAVEDSEFKSQWGKPSLQEDIKKQLILSTRKYNDALKAHDRALSVASKENPLLAEQPDSFVKRIEAVEDEEANESLKDSMVDVQRVLDDIKGIMEGGNYDVADLESEVRELQSQMKYLESAIADLQHASESVLAEAQATIDDASKVVYNAGTEEGRASMLVKLPEGRGDTATRTVDSFLKNYRIKWLGPEPIGYYKGNNVYPLKDGRLVYADTTVDPENPATIISQRLVPISPEASAIEPGNWTRQSFMEGIEDAEYSGDISTETRRRLEKYADRFWEQEVDESPIPQPVEVSKNDEEPPAPLTKEQEPPPQEDPSPSPETQPEARNHEFADIPDKVSVSIPTKAIKSAIPAMKKMMEKKHNLPILGNVAVVSKDGKTTFTATNLEIAVQYTIATPGVPDGATTIPFTALESASKEKVGSVTMDAEGDNATLSAGGSTKGAATLPIMNFPEIPKAVNRVATLNTPALMEAIDIVLPSISQGDSRFTLNGALLEFSGGKARLVSTDGHRLSLVEFDAPQVNGEKTKFLIHKRALEASRQFLGKEEDELPLMSSDNGVHISLQSADGSKSVLARQLDGNFPNYQRVMPSPDSWKSQITVGREDLLNIVDRAIKTYKEAKNTRSMAVALSFRDGQVTGWVDLGDGGATMKAKAHSRMSLINGGEDSNPRTSLDARYVRDFLKSIEDESVQVLIQDGDHVIEFRPMGKESVRNLIMPMREGRVDFDDEWAGGGEPPTPPRSLR